MISRTVLSVSLVVRLISAPVMEFSAPTLISLNTRLAFYDRLISSLRKLLPLQAGYIAHIKGLNPR